MNRGSLYRQLSQISFRHRKGFTYLIVVSLMLVVLLGVFFAQSKYSNRDQFELYSVRIKTMNDFVNNFNTDVHRATNTAAFRAMIALEDHVTSNGEYVDNVSYYFEEAFYNGTINGTISIIMQNSTFKDYVTKVSLLADEVGIVLNSEVTSIDLSQPDPWSVDVNVHIILNLTDSRGLAYWYKEEEFLTNVPIYNLRDPLYGVNTLNKIPNTIRVLNASPLVDGTDASNLNELLNGSYYLASSDAPSFLMRFEGRTDSDPNGIESVVYIQPISDQGLPVYVERVKIDYIYFNDLSTDKICDVENVNSDYHFVVPSDRVSLYELSTLNYSVSCP